MSNANQADVRLLTTVVKIGLVIAGLGWGLGTWYIEVHHAMGGHHHKVFLEHEASESLNQLESAQMTRELSLQVEPAKITQNTEEMAVPKPAAVEPPLPEAPQSSPANQAAPMTPIPDTEPPRAPISDSVKTWQGDRKLEGSIFVSIAAYREQRGPRTIASAFERAKNPELLYIGLYQQWDPKKDPDGTNFTEYCGPQAPTKDTHPLCSYLDHVTKVELHWTESEGPCVARANAEAMISGQEYAMQIDAHSTFVQDWDEMLIRMWKQTKNEYAVLSGYPRSEGEMSRGGTDGVNTAKKFNNIPMICTARMLDWSVRDMLKNTPGFSPMRPHPVRTPYFGAGLVFSKAHRLERVPYDEHMHYLFDGEEFDMAMRLFTHGYDIYAPNETPLYHFYSSPELNKRMGIQKFWDYQWGKRFPIMFKSTRRLRHKIGIPEVLAQDPKVNQTDLSDWDKYKNGDKRTVPQFLEYAGVDLVGKKVNGACRKVRDRLAHVPWNPPFEGEDPVNFK